jgi:hypothetical protein
MVQRVEPQDGGPSASEPPSLNGTANGAGAPSESEARMEREFAVILSRRPALKSPRSTSATGAIGDDEVVVAQPTRLVRSAYGASSARTEPVAKEPLTHRASFSGGIDEADTDVDHGDFDEPVDEDGEPEVAAPRRRLWQRSKPLAGEPEKLVTIARRSRRRAGLNQALSWVVALTVVAFILAAVALIVVGPPKGMMMWPSALSVSFGSEVPVAR